MKNNELISKFNFEKFDDKFQSDEVAIIKTDIRQKDTIKYNCICLKTGYREDFIHYLKEIKFENTYIKKTKERAINSEIYNLDYILSFLSKFFKYIIIEKNALEGNKKIPNYQSIFTYKNYIYFSKIIKNNTNSFLLDEPKNINVDNLISLLEKRVHNTEYINSIQILLDNGYKDISPYRPYFQTQFKYLIFKIENSKEYNDIIIVFNIKYGVVDSLYFNNSLYMKKVLDEYKTHLKEFSLGVGNKIIEYKE